VTRTTEITVTAFDLPLPDLIVSDFTATPTEPDQPIPLSITIKNKGDKLAVASEVWIFGDPPATRAATDQPLRKVAVPQLNPAATANVTVTLPGGTFTAGPHVLLAVADGAEALEEHKEDNNEQTWTLSSRRCPFRRSRSACRHPGRPCSGRPGVDGHHKSGRRPDFTSTVTTLSGTGCFRCHPE